MFLRITRASLILCLIQSVGPQSTRSSEELSKILAIFETTTPSSVASAPGSRAVEFISEVGARSGEECETNAGMTGICGQSEECTEPSERGNCIGFLEICCPNSVQPVEVTSGDKGTVPTLSAREAARKAGCGYRHPGGIGERGIIKGQLKFAYFGEFPWMVGILTNQVSDDGVWNDKTYQGGGTLIGPRAVLTAAHVVLQSELDGVPLKVRAGESDTEKDEYYSYIESPVQTVIMHDQFNDDNKRNDIALLILKDPINTNKHIDYACLPTQDQKVPMVKKCLATGWGKNQYGAEGRLQHRLKKIELPIVPQDECQERLRNTRLGAFFNLHSSFICAGGDETKEDTCEGDGGSPLVCPIPDVNMRYIQHGIVSWGIECANKNPGGYIDVGYFRDWIDEKMQKADLDTSTYSFS